MILKLYDGVEEYYKLAAKYGNKSGEWWKAHPQEEKELLESMVKVLELIRVERKLDKL
jgi:hypothetical protein